MREPSATVLIPTHNSTWTLVNSVQSALRQSITDLEVLIVGDGIQDQTREVVHSVMMEDSRVRLLDLPKGDKRGEVNRDIGVRDAKSNYIFYLADDDVLLSNHVENLLPALDKHDLVQSLNGFINEQGELELWLTNLADEVSVEWHRQGRRNRVSLTGTAHKKSTYLKLDSGWEVAPDELWPDLYLWRKFFNSPSFHGVTVPRMSTIQFPSHVRALISEDRFKEIYQFWLEICLGENASERLEYLVLDALVKGRVRVGR